MDRWAAKLRHDTLIGIHFQSAGTRTNRESTGHFSFYGVRGFQSSVDSTRHCQLADPCDFVCHQFFVRSADRTNRRKSRCINADTVRRFHSFETSAVRVFHDRVFGVETTAEGSVVVDGNVSVATIAQIFIRISFWRRKIAGVAGHHAGAHRIWSGARHSRFTRNTFDVNRIRTGLNRCRKPGSSMNPAGWFNSFGTIAGTTFFGVGNLLNRSVFFDLSRARLRLLVTQLLDIRDSRFSCRLCTSTVFRTGFRNLVVNRLDVAVIGGVRSGRCLRNGRTG